VGGRRRNLAGFSLKVQRTAVIKYLNTNSSLEPNLLNTLNPTQSPLHSFLPAMVALLAITISAIQLLVIAAANKITLLRLNSAVA